MASGSQRTWSVWEKTAARACAVCGERVLNSEASATRYDDVNGVGWAWHGHCMPSLRITPERGPEWFKP